MSTTNETKLLELTSLKDTLLRKGNYTAAISPHIYVTLSSCKDQYGNSKWSYELVSETGQIYTNPRDYTTKGLCVYNAIKKITEVCPTYHGVDIKDLYPKKGTKKAMKFEDLTTKDTKDTDEPKPKAATKVGDSLGKEDAVKELLKIIAGDSEDTRKGEVDMDEVKMMIKSEVDTYKLPFTIEGEVTPEDLEPLPELTHKFMPKLLKAVRSGVNVMLVGPAGGGKTTACEQLARQLKVPFHFNGMLDGAHEIKGYPEIDGSYNETPSYLAYKNGGVYLKDEMDADHAEVTVAFNMMLANDKFRFAQGYEHKHKDFVAIAACNTYGKGADRQYVGRNQLDAATLDRFVIIDWDYDESLERTLARNDEWVSTVQELRRGVERAKVRHIISPRASIEGAKLLRNGFSKDEVLDMVVWKGLPKEQQQKVKKG